MSLVSEIVVEQGNENLDVDGWRVCSFWDEDVDGNEFMNFEVLTSELANVGLPILCVVVGVMIVNWLDRNVFNKTRRYDD